MSYVLYYLHVNTGGSRCTYEVELMSPIQLSIFTDRLVEKNMMILKPYLYLKHKVRESNIHINVI